MKLCLAAGSVLVLDSCARNVSLFGLLALALTLLYFSKETWTTRRVFWSQFELFGGKEGSGSNSQLFHYTLVALMCLSNTFLSNS